MTQTKNAHHWCVVIFPALYRRSDDIAQNDNLQIGTLQEAVDNAQVELSRQTSECNRMKARLEELQNSRQEHEEKQLTLENKMHTLEREKRCLEREKTVLKVSHAFVALLEFVIRQ